MTEQHRSGDDVEADVFDRARRDSGDWKRIILERARRDEVFCAIIVSELDAVLDGLTQFRAQLIGAGS